jgi:hypothetical protein
MAGQITSSNAEVIDYTIDGDIRWSVISLLKKDVGHEPEQRYQQLLSCCRIVDSLI